jgi:putative transposase
MRRKTPFFVGQVYHIYNRGNDKKIIFNGDYDYKRFMLLLYLCNSTTPVDIRRLLEKGLSFVELFDLDRGDTLVDIGGFCAMPNHFHLLLHEKMENGISQFMKKLLTSYSMYFNAKNERKGALFEGPFRDKHIDTDSYLNWVFSYIHLNPVKLIDNDWKEKGISDPVIVKNFIDSYKYSSYYDYFLGNRPENSVLSKDAFPGDFSQLDDFEDLIQEFRKDNY